MYPTQATTKVATIFALKSGLGVYLDDGVLRAKTSADGTIIGSAATNATALDEWHHVMLVVDGMTLVGDTIYAFGGWTSAGFSGDFFSCSLTGGSCTDLTYGCHFAPDLPTATDVGLTPRYEVTMANNGKFIVVTGGVSSEMTGHQEAFKFYIDGCSWQKMKLSTTVTATALQGSSGVLSDGSAVYAFAGDSASHNFADVFLLGV